MLEFNHGALKYEIKEQYGTYAKFANALGISAPRMSDLLNCKAAWSDKMIYKAAMLLGGTDNIAELFFTPKTSKSDRQ